MKTIPTLGEILQAQGVSRRGFMKYCAATASLLALPPAMVPRIANALEQARRPSVIWLSFQECTGCTESLLRSTHPTLEHLILDLISLDYHEALSTPSGHLAEQVRHQSMKENHGKYVLVVDGAIPTKDGGIYCKVANRTMQEHLAEASEGAAAIIAIGSCAAWGGIPSSGPNPTGALTLSDICTEKRSPLYLVVDYWYLCYIFKLINKSILAH